MDSLPSPPWSFPSARIGTDWSRNWSQPARGRARVAAGRRHLVCQNWLFNRFDRGCDLVVAPWQPKLYLHTDPAFGFCFDPSLSARRLPGSRSTAFRRNRHTMICGEPVTGVIDWFRWKYRFEGNGLLRRKNGWFRDRKLRVISGNSGNEVNLQSEAGF